MTAYVALLHELHALRRFGMRPGLDGMQALLARLGHPERALAVIHVAGTNGKGSTAAMIEAALREHGLTTGLYTSPHLSRVTERIRVDGKEIDEATAAALGARVFAVGGEYTFFEILTALALLHFAERAVDVAVLEVGLGGRLDATNVIAEPLATLVTSVALDHAEVLGDTPAKIAREKAGIFKPGVPAIFACDDEGARAVLLETAASVGAPAHLFGRDFDDADLPSLGLLGAHQRRNAALARRALSLLPAALRPSSRAVADGLSRVQWPGRLEWLAPDVLVDAAHNEEGARALAASLPSLTGGRALTLVTGVVADKDARAILAPLLPLCARVIATTPLSPRALPAAELAALVPAATAIADPAQAILAARAHGGVTLVAGSIFLVAEARRILLGERADPLPVQDPLKRT